MEVAEKKILTFKSQSLKNEVGALADIAKNALNEEDQLINFMCYDEVTYLTATDSSNECQIELETNSNVREVFALNVNNLQAVLTDEGVTTIEVHDSFVLIHKNEDTVQMTKFSVNHKPFKPTRVTDTINREFFLSILKIYSKYLTSNDDESNVIIFSDNLAYIHNRLYYAITECELGDIYIFDKTTCRNLVRIFSKHKEKDLSFHKDKDKASIYITSKNTTLRVPMFAHDKIDLDKFIKIEAHSGFAVDRAKLIQVLKEIETVEGTNEVDILTGESRLIVRPSTESSLTEYKLFASGVAPEGKTPKEFTYTVNAKSLSDLLRGVNSKTTMLVSTDKNMLLLFNQDLDITIRYFISVY